MLPLDPDIPTWAAYLPFTLGWITALVAAVVAGAGAAIGKTTAKAINQGVMPWDDVGGHFKDIFVDTIPVTGPLVETATEGGDWGDAAMTSGLQLASIVGGGALGGLENVGTEAAKAGAAGINTFAEAGAPIAAETAKLAGTAGTSTGFLSETLKTLGDTYSAYGPGAITEGLQSTLGEIPGKIASGGLFGAATGAARNPKDALRGALSGLASGAVGGLVQGGMNQLPVRQGYEQLASSVQPMSPVPSPTSSMFGSYPDPTAGQSFALSAGGVLGKAGSKAAGGAVNMLTAPKPFAPQEPGIPYKAGGVPDYGRMYGYSRPPMGFGY